MGKEYRVFGPPGTGKTTFLTKQVKNAVKKHGSESVIVASFTNASAKEIGSRELPLDDRQVGTLHSHCYRALDYPEVAEGNIKDFNKFAPQYKLSTKEKKDIDNPNLVDNTESKADQLFLKYQNLRARMIEKKLWPTSISNFAEKWEKWKKVRGFVDFTDMISISLEEIDGPTGCPYIAFFDEAQDFTPLELALVRKWSEVMEWIVICGDDDQNLYEFKGAKPEAFLDPPIPDDQVIILNQSYRVPKKIQKLANNWIKQLAVRKEKEYKPRDFEGELRDLKKGNWKNPDPIFQDSEKYLQQGKTVMFLTTCSYMLDNIKAGLRERGIPFHNPYRKKRGDWNPLSSTRGTSSVERLLAYYRISNKVYEDQARMWTLDDLDKFITLIRSKNVLHRGAKTQLSNLILNFDDDENIDITKPLSINRLLDFFKEEALMKLLDLDIDFVEQNILGSRKKALDFPFKIIKNYGPEKLKEKPKIIIGTIHSIKGGEADVVYLFPDLSSKGIKQWLKTKGKDAIIRQFYVGMTRARESLILCNPATNYRVPLNSKMFK